MVPSLPPTPLPSVLHPPDQCRPGNLCPFRILHSPCPHLTPNPLCPTHTTPPTLAHWWFSTRGTQSPHPTDGSLPLMHQTINLHPPTPCPTLPLSRYRLTTHHLLCGASLSSSPFLPSAFGSAFHSVHFLTLSPLCVSLPSFQISAISPFPHIPTIAPLLFPIPHAPHQSLSRWLLLQSLTSSPINLFQELYH